MKKIIALVLFAFVLAGCSNAITDDLKPYRGQTAAQIFNHAELNLAKHNYSDAAKGFQALNALYPFGPYARQAQLDIIYAYYKSDDTVSAEVAADRYIRLYPRGKDVVYAYYMRGLLNYKDTGTWLQRKFHQDPAKRADIDKRKAYMAFDQIVQLYPHSVYAKSAVVYMRAIRNMVARKQIYVAEFYLKRKAYIAAANRAADVVRHFNRTPSVVDALEILVESYHALHLNKMAQKSYAILKLNFPHSKQFEKATRVMHHA